MWNDNDCENADKDYNKGMISNMTTWFLSWVYSVKVKVKVITMRWWLQWWQSYSWVRSVKVKVKVKVNSMWWWLQIWQPDSWVDSEKELHHVVWKWRREASAWYLFSDLLLKWMMEILVAGSSVDSSCIWSATVRKEGCCWVDSCHLPA